MEKLRASEIGRAGLSPTAMGATVLVDGHG
jgi:hypothetical protein